MGKRKRIVWKEHELDGLNVMIQESKGCPNRIIKMNKDIICWKGIMSYSEADEFISKIQESRLVQKLEFAETHCYQVNYDGVLRVITSYRK